MMDIIVKIFIGIIVVGGIAWGIWHENFAGKKKTDDEDKKK